MYMCVCVCVSMCLACGWAGCLCSRRQTAEGGMEGWRAGIFQREECIGLRGEWAHIGHIHDREERGEMREKRGENLREAL